MHVFKSEKYFSIKLFEDDVVRGFMLRPQGFDLISLFFFISTVNLKHAVHDYIAIFHCYFLPEA